MSSSPVLVYIIEGNPEHRTLLHDIVESHSFRARMFGSGEEFLTAYNRLSPGVVLLDLRLPGMGGAPFVEELARRGCSWPIIILTAHPTAREAERARKASAVDILAKPIKSSVILTALESARGKVTAPHGDEPNPAVLARFAMLKPGERAVLDGLREGLLTRQIATRCAVSERTVRARVKQMLKKTGAGSREHLVQLAGAEGMPDKAPT